MTENKIIHITKAMRRPYGYLDYPGLLKANKFKNN